MAKKKPKGDVDEQQLVTVPEIAPEGVPFAEVVYENRGHHKEEHECCGVTFEPGHVLTFRSMGAVPQAMKDDPALRVVPAQMGACRRTTMFRYSPMSGPEFNALKAQADAADAALQLVSVPDELGPDPLPDEAEPFGDSEHIEPEGDE